MHSTGVKIIYKLFELVGPTMLEFREELMKKGSPKTLQEVIRQLIPPKGVKRKSNIGGSELLDCEGELIDNCKNEDISDNENENVSDETTVTMEKSPLNSQEPSSSSKSSTSVNLSLISSDPDIKSDSEFLEKLHNIMVSHETSKLFTPFSVQLKARHGEV